VDARHNARCIFGGIGTQGQGSSSRDRRRAVTTNPTVPITERYST
jgi:hypothetical protein